MTTHRHALAVSALVLAATGCSASAAGPLAAHEGHEHGHQSPAELAAALVRAKDLPVGYRAGHAHHSEQPTRAPKVSPACAPIAELIGAHHGVRQHEHPEARATLSKSHFGPTLGETIIDYGEPGVAARAIDRLDRAARACRTYVQSTAASGANRYRVLPGPEISERPGASTLRLDALGSDFDIRWDVTWLQYGAQVVAVDFRSAPGGDNDDLGPAVDAAVTRIEAGEG